MSFLVANVWYLLAATAVFYVLTIAFQLRNINRIRSFDTNISLAPVLVCAVGAFFSSILFAIGLIGLLIQYAKS